MIRSTGLRSSTAVLLTAIACLASEARATLLVYEGFDGYTAGALKGQTPNANTVGLNQSVGYYHDAGTPRDGNYTLTTGLTLGSLAVSGGALAYPTGTNVIGADIDIGATPFTGTLWSSYLTRITTRGTSLSGDGSLLRIGDSPGDGTDARYHTFADSRSGSPNVAVGYAGINTGDNTISSSPLTFDTTYIIIGRFTNVGSSGGVATVWALDETQFAAFLAAGGDEDALANTSVTATASHTNQYTARNFVTGDAFALAAINGTGVFDEVRFGSALADVTPIPEPSSAVALAGLAAIGATFLPRRRRR